MSIDPKSPCNLCALEVGPHPHLLHTREKDFVFCCEGCVGIYKMLNDVDEIDAEEKNPNQSDDIGTTGG